MKRSDCAGACPLGARRDRGWLRLGSRRWAVAVLCLLTPAYVARANTSLANPRTVEAAFLRNFAHYVTWPPQTSSGDKTPWQIGVLGDEALGEVLERTCRGRTEQGRSFAVFRADTPEQLPACQIVFIGYKDAARRRDALARWRGRAVLTVGDAPTFLEEGGVIGFRITDRVEMSINLDHARAALMNIPTQMLEVAHEVVENGRVSQLR